MSTLRLIGARNNKVIDNKNKQKLILLLKIKAIKNQLKLRLV